MSPFAYQLKGSALKAAAADSLDIHGISCERTSARLRCQSLAGRESLPVFTWGNLQHAHECRPHLLLTAVAAIFGDDFNANRFGYQRHTVHSGHRSSTG